jgi:hypothetical protein
MSERVKQGEDLTEDWSTANRNARPGDRAFLIRLGEEPRGIFASGTVATEPHLRRHWDAQSAASAEETYFVGVALDTLLNPLSDDVLRRDKLDISPLSNYDWDTESSGVVIPDDAAQELERIWVQYARKTGLIDEIVEAFRALGGTAQYSDLYDYMEKHATHPLPRTWKDSVRAKIHERSSDSKDFQGKADLFYYADALGSGVWGLRPMLHATPPAPDTGQPSDPAKRALIEDYRIIRDTKTTRQLKTLYQDKCQICGTAIALYGTTYSEAHHVQPLGEPHNGPDIASNIVIVCPNHHVQLDYGALAIDPETMMIIPADTHEAPQYRKLLLDPKHRLGAEFLQYHLDNIFGHGI